jgi:hypothetical protein
MMLQLCVLVLAQADAGSLDVPDAGPAPAPLSVIDQVLAVFKPYVLVKPTVIPSFGAVESFSQPNATAVTAAGNPVLATAPGAPRLTFQVAQSRAGLHLNPQGTLRGQLEVDFIDFAKASPTVASLPRLRIAKAEWLPVPVFTLSVGQDWDLFSPLNPHGSNMVGAHFLSGNLGFMRQQVKVLGKVGSFELAAAAGMEGVNITSRDSALELSLVPTGAFRVQWVVPQGRVGVSGIATSLRLGMGSAMERRAFAGAVSVHGELTLPRLQLRAEAYVGQNTANLGLLGLGLGGARDVSELGGFGSARVGLSGMHWLYSHVGYAQAFDASAVRPSYSYSILPSDGSLPATSTATLAGTGPGIQSNLGATLGYELRISPQLGFVLEFFVYRTLHALQEFDQQRFSSLQISTGAELAALASF